MPINGMCGPTYERAPLPQLIDFNKVESEMQIVKYAFGKP